MPSPFDLIVTLELGTRRRALALGEFVKALGDPSLLPKILALALGSGVAAVDPPPPPTPNEELANENRSPSTTSASLENRSNARNVNVNENIYIPVTLRGPEVPSGESGRADLERIAAHLADALSDWKSLAFFRKVARSVPESVIRDALTRALDLPAASIRRSRAAYFTSIVRPYLARSDPGRAGGDSWPGT